MRKALIVGIDCYENISPLYGCVNDASRIRNVLAQNAYDNSLNFDIRLKLAESARTYIIRGGLKDDLEQLFLDGGATDTALFYFSGHGYVETTGGWICTSECVRGDDGLSLHEVVTLANKSRAQNKIIILDSCHSGAAAGRTEGAISEIGEGVTVLTASTASQYAMESEGGGIFTGLLLDALKGAAANLTGDITPGSVYAYIDQSLGAWEQRPVFKTNVKNFVSLRKVKPPIPLSDLRRITKIFPQGTDEYKLDPTYEPDDGGKQNSKDYATPEHTEIFAVLQNYNRVNLILPVEAEHLYFAAMNRKSVQLTALGRHYRNLVLKGRI